MHTTGECAWCIKVQFNDCNIDSASTDDWSSYGRKKLNPQLKEYERGMWIYPVDLAIYDSFPKFPNLAEASRSGCQFGRFLKEVLESADVQRQLDDDISDFKNRFIPFKLGFDYAWGAFDDEDGVGNSGLEALRITLHLDTVEGSSHDKNPPFYVVCRVHKSRDDSRCHDWLGIERPHDRPQSGDENAVAWMKGQLAECDEQRGPHLAHCGVDYIQGFLPNRLIDLRTSTLKVVSRANVVAATPRGSPTRRYAALSYCWGTLEDAADQLLLLKSSLDAEGRFAIPSHDLPAVIRDAVAVARSLSLQYLWVDALCILQDDQSDWEAESSRMDWIYGCAYITICSFTASCNTSFLSPEVPITTIDFRSAMHPDIIGQYSISYYYCVSIGKGASILTDRVMENRWARRGWTFQEAFLSGRLLCFEQSDVSFSCFDRIAYLSGHDSARPLASLRWLEAYTEEPRGSVWAIWYQWVLSGYCDRSFTHRDDIFPAVSGVARMFQNTFGAKYLAGLWDTDLAVGLMWEVGAKRHRGDLSGVLIPQQPTTLIGLLTALGSDPYVSPSWSWASRRAWVDSPIVSESQVWRSIRDECHLATSVSVAGSNPLGRVNDAWIEFTGTTVTIGPDTPVLPPNESSTYYMIALGNRASVQCRFDWHIDATILHGSFKMILLGSCIKHLETKDPDSLPGPSQPTLQNAVPERTAFGIVIHQKPLSNAFFRVGTFYSVPSEGGGLKYFDNFGREKLKII